MKYVPVPSRKELERAFERLQWNGEPNPSEIVRWAHWARLDARLAELLISHLAKHFRRLNPFALSEENHLSPQPQALAVLLEFAKIEAAASLSGPNQKSFRRWCRVITQDLEVASPQSFFVDDGRPNPARARGESETSLKPYRRWGFFGREDLLAKKAGCQAAALAKPERARVLEALRSSRPSFTVNDYIEACQGRVHRRTAERDLHACRDIKHKGFTRRRRYSAV